METFFDRGEEYPVDVCPYCGCGLEFHSKGKVVCPECHDHVKVPAMAQYRKGYVVNTDEWDDEYEGC